MSTRELIALIAAFVAGVAVERYRQGRRRAPLRLADTPRAWVDSVRHSVGEVHALAAGLAVAAALTVLLLPSFSSDPTGRDRARRVGLAPAAEKLPELEVARKRAGREFKMRGLTFRVFRLPDSWPGSGALGRPAGRGRAWLSVGVDVRNVGRRRFRPSTVSYRLKDGRGRSYWPEVGGGTGPASLAESGRLERGVGGAAMRLRFRVPRGARRFALVFEPGGASARQVRVPLGGAAL
jgi:hypothetical protein